MKIIANEYSPQDILKILREWSEQTQEDFGLSIKKTRKVIRNIEQGITDFKVETLLEIAEAHDLVITIEKK